MTKVFNRVSETDKRRALRNNMPDAEILLWSKLRGKGLNGHKFRRQYSVDRFVMDFYCPQLKLAIEIDGDSHFTVGAEEYDRERQEIIESYSISFLRFTNAEVRGNIEGVVLRIKEYLP
ncbi:MAG: endonuclease domain-containing protein [Nitrospirae bacterium]|nr:endonuclease domain-containing protein [Nitrospirota bacterium]